MKVIHEESIYILPDNQRIVILVQNENITDLLDCLINAFVKKKRNYCKIYDENNDVVDFGAIEFIYYPYTTMIDSNFQLSSKSFFNLEFTKLIEENIKDFSSIEKIRENLFECRTDVGFYKFRKILTKGLNVNIDFGLNEFNISLLLSMLQISTDNLSDDIKYQILYNLAMYINRDKFQIAYIDFPINQKTIEWIKTKDENMVFFLNNDMIMSDVKMDNCTMVVLSKNDYMEKYELGIDEFDRISYMQNEFVKKHIRYQIDKNIQLIKQFSDETITYFLNFADINSANRL